MKAIQVRYLGPTNTKGSRYIAKAEGVKSLTQSFNHMLNDGGRKLLAKRLCIENKWDTNLVEGQLPNGDYVFCFKNQ